MSEKILEVRQLATSFHTERGWQQAIDGVSFDVYQGEILGIVGESGCGKSVTSQSIMRLYDERRLVRYSGTVKLWSTATMPRWSSSRRYSPLLTDDASMLSS